MAESFKNILSWLAAPLTLGSFLMSSQKQEIEDFIPIEVSGKTAHDAIRGDWENVGASLRIAMDKYKTQGNHKAVDMADDLDERCENY